MRRHHFAFAHHKHSIVRHCQNCVYPLSPTWWRLTEFRREEDFPRARLTEAHQRFPLSNSETSFVFKRCRETANTLQEWLAHLKTWFEITSRFAFRSFNREPQACAFGTTPFSTALRSQTHSEFRARLRLAVKLGTGPNQPELLEGGRDWSETRAGVVRT